MVPALDPRADAAVAEFAADCGPDVWKMDAACETYLNQYLANCPVELELMVAALRVGVPKRIATRDPREGYDDYLAELADKFAAAAHTDREAAAWAVGAWAAALGKPVGYRPPEEAPEAGKVYPVEPAEDGSETVVKVVMAAIVTAGGFLGGTIGGAALPLVAMAIDAIGDTHPGATGHPGKSSAAAVTTIMVILAMLTTGTVSALGALGGWWLGRGSERPWATFGTAFAAALGTSLMVMFCLGPFAGAFMQFAAVFGASFRSAARGGE